MRLREIFIPTKGTRTILVITFSVSILAVVFAFFYYRRINNSEDPRIRKAREFLVKYDKASGNINSIEQFPFLDSADVIFKSYPDYETSFEVGVIYNNKCSALLLSALYDSTINATEKSTLLALSMDYCDSSIFIYENWIAEWGKLSPENIADRISIFMNEKDPEFKDSNFRMIFSGRVKNIVKAQIETPRRLSVSLSNKGTIYRHMMKLDSALNCYQLAISLWKDNRTAKSNMTVLMGGKPVKPSIIESLFPPDKNKK
jgi:tetratricopeptide (TPR) repeat protein